MNTDQGMTPTPEVVNATEDPATYLARTRTEELDRLRRGVLEALAPPDSNLVHHARFELDRINELGERGAYGGMVGQAALDLIRVLASQGHSGGSVGMTLGLFERLARFDVLSELTAHPGEWREVPEEMRPGAQRTWQSTRKPSVFWREGEATWYDIDAPTSPKTQG